MTAATELMTSPQPPSLEPPSTPLPAGEHAMHSAGHLGAVGQLAPPSSAGSTPFFHGGSANFAGATININIGGAPPTPRPSPESLYRVPRTVLPDTMFRTMRPVTGARHGGFFFSQP